MKILILTLILFTAYGCADEKTPAETTTTTAAS